MFVLRNSDGARAATRTPGQVDNATAPGLLERALSPRRVERTRHVRTRVANMTAAEFVQAGTSQFTYWYHTSRLKEWPEQAQRLLRGHKTFELAVDASEVGMGRGSGNGLPESEAMMWLSHAGVVSQTHYDQTNNMFIQLVGSKRMLLYPPEAWPSMHVYPSFHPSYRQSQVKTCWCVRLCWGLAQLTCLWWRLPCVPIANGCSD